jgi:hypothetical protein
VNILYLTTEERRVFDALAASVREGWEVQEERPIQPDSVLQRAARLSLMRLHDPKLQAFQEKARQLSSETDLLRLAQDMDLSGVSDDDLAELSFALGPVALSALIGFLLRSTKTEKDLQDVASLLVLRHSLIDAFQPQA